MKGNIINHIKRQHNPILKIVNQIENLNINSKENKCKKSNNAVNNQLI
ncbi:hypothetical protein PCIT_a4414 [Pseudoalteromonas citrea]|uniref:Uncharacterized protein n=1 Tax=Pseudoalteromonas citrea TaxID=43655 RepID=A0AAD4AG38_9GAMM|nr:hypothetical protein PCIT_a4414 [Pseudoalteromonas citrea]